MNQRFTFWSVGIISLLAIMAGCKKQDTSTILTAKAVSRTDETNAKVNTFYGPRIQVGNGLARTYSVISHAGNIQEMGIELTAGVLENLPAPLPEQPEGPEYSWLLDLHQKGRALTPFDHIEFDWNPVGHQPPGVYDKAHFDLHFYKISKEEQDAIPEYNSETMALHDQNPPPGYIPEGYASGPGGLAKMGKHWVDTWAPEFHGGSFTHTMVYGSYAGKVIFLEPMITKAFLDHLQGEVITPIRQPQYYDPSHTNYPTAYRICKDPSTGNIYISVIGFEWKG